MAAVVDRARRGRQPFWRRLLMAAPLLLGVPFVSLWVDSNEGIESASLDFQRRIAPPRAGQRVVVVHIDPQDYDSLFGGRTPLDPLRVQQIIGAIAKGRPSVIGVDIDTRSGLYRGFPDTLNGVPIVWGYPASCPDDGLLRCESRALVPGPVRGDSTGTAFPANSGLAMVELERDGSVRRYRRTSAITGGRSVPSFASAILREAGQPEYAADSTGDRRLINFRPYPAVSFPASWVLRNADTRDFQGEAGALRGQVVVFGAGHRATDDWHQTPVGRKSGAEVWGQIVETELEGGGKTLPSKLFVVLFQVAAGILFVILFRSFKHIHALAASLVVSGMISLVASVVAFHSIWFVLYFIPLLLFLLVQEVFDLLADRGMAALDDDPAAAGVENPLPRPQGDESLVQS